MNDPAMNRREFSRKLAAGVGGALLAPVLGTSARAEGKEASAAPARPNLVLYMSDQHAYRYAGFMGHPIVRTPNLDRIARRGVVFTSTYCGSPVCTPSRAGLLSGVYPSDVNSFGNSTVWDGSVPAWPALLRDAGYLTFGTGKMDCSDRHDMGFSRAVHISNGHEYHPDITAFFRRPLCCRVDERRVIDGHGRQERYRHDTRVMQTTIDFIRGQKGATTPWAAYCGGVMPHSPYIGLEDLFGYYLNRVGMPNIPPGSLEELPFIYQQLRHFKNIATPIPDERIRRARAGYYAMITEVDENIGRIWDALEQTGQLENTVFVYCSDHGESLGEHGLWMKNNLYDVASRVPLVMAGAGIPRGVRVDTPVAHVDLTRTILGWGGAKLDPRLRGHSLVPLMHGTAGDHPGWAYSESHSEGNCTGSFMIRKGDWKYYHISWQSGALFNLAEDPDEFHNCLHEPRARPVVEELQAILRSQVEPEKVTERAFAAQRARMDRLAQGKSPGEMVRELRSRLGEGQAVELLNAYYGHTFPYTRTVPLDTAG